MSVRNLNLLLCLFCIYSLFIAGCQTIKNPSKYQFAEGYYYSRLYHKKVKKVYIVPGDDSIKIYSVKRMNEGIDTSQSLKIAFPSGSKPASFEDYTFKKTSFDVDLLNILFKFRPSVKGFPPQFNNNILNAALYAGERWDLFKLKYHKTPLQKYERTITHYACSFGVFSGIGASRIDEYVTLNGINIEYDGVVNTSGVAIILAMDKINFGLNLGVDHLLDKNKSLWIYQGKPWIGIAVGLNLN